VFGTFTKPCKTEQVKMRIERGSIQGLKEKDRHIEQLSTIPHFFYCSRATQAAAQKDLKNAELANIDDSVRWFFASCATYCLS